MTRPTLTITPYPEGYQLTVKDADGVRYYYASDVEQCRSLVAHFAAEGIATAAKLAAEVAAEVAAEAAAEATAEAAAGDVAWEAAWKAARDAQNTELERLIREAREAHDA